MINVLKKKVDRTFTIFFFKRPKLEFGQHLPNPRKCANYFDLKMYTIFHKFFLHLTKKKKVERKVKLNFFRPLENHILRQNFSSNDFLTLF